MLSGLQRKVPLENTRNTEQNQYFCQAHVLEAGNYEQNNNSVMLVLLIYLNFEYSLSGNSLYTWKWLTVTSIIGTGKVMIIILNCLMLSDSWCSFKQTLSKQNCGIVLVSGDPAEIRVYLSFPPLCLTNWEKLCQKDTNYQENQRW